MATTTRAIVMTDQERLGKLADQIAALALEQCRVYATQVPPTTVRGILPVEVTSIQKQRTLEYAVLKAMERRVIKG
jgi:hypothetical protein